MKILALEPYFGGSHRAFLEGWSRRSRHMWTLLTLPAYKWKWRMRHAAITFAGQVEERVRAGEEWDLVFCSDMLNLAEFLGLAPAAVQRLPSVVYFHENQLTYPVRVESERDYQFAMTNLTTALAATRVWFNSAFHRDTFLAALGDFLRRMPDYEPLDAVEAIRAKSEVQYPGIDEPPPRGERKPGLLRLLWAARWEHDKNPETFFEALKILKANGTDFRLSVIGEQFRDSPEVFDWAREHFKEHLDRWGYQESRRAYLEALAEADVIVSTAEHEFFGLTVVEAIAAGAYPLLPRRLSYPELLAPIERSEEFFYDGSAEDLAEKLEGLAGRNAQDDLWRGQPRRAVRAVERFFWRERVSGLDESLAMSDSSSAEPEGGFGEC